MGKRAPLLDEHSEQIHKFLENTAGCFAARQAAPDGPAVLSSLGKPFALQGIKILDFSWFLASAGGTRILASLGAESLKVEWKENPDTRLAAMAPVGVANQVLTNCVIGTNTAVSFSVSTLPDQP